ncbi:hypothetical protein APA_3258 [Pseudanabaena sp. lw0831]|nr:hypothetical protein APA_3258 [Pseudanabaena sp. lw0831]
MILGNRRSHLWVLSCDLNLMLRFRRSHICEQSKKLRSLRKISYH